MESFARREFLVSAGVCGAGALLVPVAAKTKPPPLPFDGRKKVNPAIDNLSVICGINPAMVTGDPPSWEMQGQNEVVDTVQVEKTLDAMASSLAGTTTADAAWSTIFMKPPQKEWASVRAAVKVNCIAVNHPRLSIVNKICVELHRRGVPFENIVIYDGIHNAAPFYRAYIGKGLPAGVVVSDKFDGLGGMVKTVIPEPRRGEYKCAKALVDSSIDILVDIAVNKGHDQGLGGTTLTMKNHAGTFEPMPLHVGGGMNYLIAFNKSDAIRGTTTARQQLCIIDSLWGARKGPGGPPDKRLDRLIMGTLSPVVDYLTAKKIREPLLNVQHGALERFVTEFGYRIEELPDITTVTL